MAEYYQLMCSMDGAVQLQPFLTSTDEALSVLTGYYRKGVAIIIIFISVDF